MYLQNYTVYRLVPMEMGIPMILVLQEQQRYNSTGEVSPLSHWWIIDLLNWLTSSSAPKQPPAALLSAQNGSGKAKQRYSLVESPCLDLVYEGPNLPG